MAVEIVMPKLGMTMEEGKLLEWLKAEKEEIKKGDLLFVIESDKVTFEVESPGTGILAILVDSGEGIAVGTLVGYIAATWQEYDRILSSNGMGQKQPEEDLKEDIVSEVTSIDVGKIAYAEGGTAGKIKATPAARALAKINNMDLSIIAGSGPLGRIGRKDVDNAINLGEAYENVVKVKASPGARKQAKQMGIELVDVVGTGPEQRITRYDVIEYNKGSKHQVSYENSLRKVLLKEEPMSSIRATISRRMMESIQQSAQMTAFSEWDVSELIRLRKSLNSLVGDANPKVSFPGLVVFFLARVLKEMPIFNSSVNGKVVQYWRDVNIGVAVSVDQALVVPVVRAADKKSLNETQASLSDLIERARNKSLLPDDMADGTFTLSNLGSYGSEWETVILNPPEVALLGIGAIIKKPIVVNDEIVIRSMMPISLTFDHRVIDGATAGAFRNRMKTLIENPGMLITCFSA